MTNLETKLRELKELAEVNNTTIQPEPIWSDILNLLSLIETQREALWVAYQNTPPIHPKDIEFRAFIVDVLDFNPFECPKKDSCDE